MSATADVTASLRNTMQLMQQELDRSLLSNQMLGAFSLPIRMKARAEYEGQSNLPPRYSSPATSMSRSATS